MIDVLIADHHPVIRELLRQVLKVYPDLSVVAEAVDGEDAVLQAARSDLLLCLLIFICPG